jgi:hypothetical protein
MKILFELTMPEAEKVVVPLLMHKDLKLNSLVKLLMVCVMKDFENRTDSDIFDIFDRLIKMCNSSNSKDITLKDLTNCFYPYTFTETPIFQPGIVDKKVKGLL